MERKFPRLQTYSNILFRKDGDQTHVNAEDRVAIHDQGQFHQALDTVGIINVSVEKLKDVPCHAVGKTKRLRKFNSRVVISARYFRCKHAPCIFTDRASKMRFLVDTRADISVLPIMLKDKYNKSKFTLYAANGTPIATFSQKLLQLNFGLHCNF